MATAAAIFLTPNSWDLPASGGTLELTLVTSLNSAGTAPAGNVPLSLTTSSGTLSDTAPRTDSTGHAKVTWTGTSSATITARAGDVAGTATIRVPVPPTEPPPTSPGPTPPPPPPPPPEGFALEVRPSSHTTDAVTPISFTVRVLTANVPGPLAYAWDFESDGIVDSQVAAPTHLFPPADHWDVRVVVLAADGRAGSGSTRVVIGATPVPAVTTTLSANPTTALMGATFTFTATANGNSTSGSVVAYDWDFDTTTPSVDETTTTGSATTTYPTPGARTVRVTARTGNGTSGTATTSVTVTPPALRISDLTVSGSRSAGSTLAFTVAVAAASGPVPPSLTFKWDFGNGSEVVTSASPQTINHVYAAAGKYTITVTATAPDGRTATETITITIG